MTALIPFVTSGDRPNGHGPEEERAEQTGFRDGILGQIWIEQKRVLEHEAEKQRIEEACTVEKKIDEASARLRSTSETRDRDRLELERIDRQFSLNAADRDANPSAYSLPMGILYVLIGLLFIGADYPLTRFVVADVIQIDGEAHQILVACGFVMSGFFFKFIADQLTRPKHQMGRLQRWLTSGLSTLIILSMLFTVVVSLFLFGLMRGKALAEDRASGDPEEMTVTATVAPTMTSTTGSATGTIDAVRKMPLTDLSDVSFVALGLMLPIFGGIFTSAGTSRWRNWMRMRHLTGKQQEQRKISDESSAIYYRDSAAVDQLRRDLDVVRRRPALTDGLYHSYLHAYEHGFCWPELRDEGAGMATRVRTVIARWFSMAEQSRNLRRTEKIASLAVNGVSASPTAPAGSKDVW